jgi:hypothetical protein
MSYGKTKEYFSESRLKITPGYAVAYQVKCSPYAFPGSSIASPVVKSKQLELELFSQPVFRDHPDEQIIRNSNSLANLSRAKHTGIVSKKAVKRLYTAMDWLLLIAKNKWAENNHNHRLFKYKLGLLTLTLPSDQMHSDNEIKHKALNNFFTQCRQRFELQNYLWKAEKQKNGNIHFHIVFDKYIDYSVLQGIWNKILDGMGYIEAYRNNQKAWHSNGFRPRPWLFKTWSLKSQIEAYKSGKITNWSNPSSTVDIHSLKKIRNAKAYLAKYLTKNSDVYNAFKDAKSAAVAANGGVALEPDAAQSLYDSIKKKLQVQGNIWYISQSLSKLKQVCLSLGFHGSKNVSCYNEAIGSELDIIEDLYPEKVIRKDFCTVYALDIYEIIKAGLSNMANSVRDYIVELRNKFYPPGSGRYSDLGVPLLIFDVLK